MNPLTPYYSEGDELMAEAAKQPNEMTAVEAVEAICKWDTEHDIDCEEGIGSDRCTPCLAAAALMALKTGGSAKPTDHLDHRAEALRLLEKSEVADAELAEHYRAQALVHSNLAIAEGQERVAEGVDRLLGRSGEKALLEAAAAVTTAAYADADNLRELCADLGVRLSEFQARRDERMGHGEH